MAIIDEGRIIAMGTPRQIQEKTLSNSTIEIQCAEPLRAGDLPQWAEAIKTTLDERRITLTVTSRRPARTIVEMVKWLDEQGMELADIRIKRPSLEEAFIELTGKSLRE
ncbi:ABC transporter related (fragment) [Candidatus Sulfopaludibacter sp. SbA3]